MKKMLSPWDDAFHSIKIKCSAFALTSATILPSSILLAYIESNIISNGSAFNLSRTLASLVVAVLLVAIVVSSISFPIAVELLDYVLEVKNISSTAHRGITCDTLVDALHVVSNNVSKYVLSDIYDMKMIIDNHHPVMHV